MKTATLLLGATLLTGCMSMQPVAQPQTFLERNNPEAIRLFKPYGGLLVLQHPRFLKGDSVAGFDVIENSDARYQLGQFTRIEAKQTDHRRTTFALIGGAAVIGAGIFGITHSGNATPLQCDSYTNGAHCTKTAAVIPLRILLR